MFCFILLFCFIFLQFQPMYLEPDEKGNYICEYKASWRVLKRIFKICISVVH